MISTFRLKAQTTRGVDVSSPMAQAAEIATLIGATSFIVDIYANNATFNIQTEQAGQSIVVTAGQVVSVTSGVVSVQDKAEFYEMFEADITMQ